MCHIVEAAEEWACEMQNHLRLIRPPRSLLEVGVFPLHNPEAGETSMLADAYAFLLLGRLFEAEAAAAFRWLMFVRRYWRPLPRLLLLYYYLPP